MENKKPEVFYYTSNEIVPVYHGSKGGIKGPIRPQSRDETDFGAGFYMGDKPDQPKALIAPKKHPIFYELTLNLSGLRCVEVSGVTWALLVAYNRNALENIKGTPIYDKLASITRNCDIIKGPIADDKMFDVLDEFYTNSITDYTLMNCLKSLPLGNQYVAKTDLACGPEHIRITKETPMTPEERKEIRERFSKEHNNAIKTAEDYIADAKRQRYRIGHIFEEILKEGEQYAIDITPNPTL